MMGLTYLFLNHKPSVYTTALIKDIPGLSSVTELRKTAEKRE
jgi:hypothetical protein